MTMRKKDGLMIDIMAEWVVTRLNMGHYQDAIKELNNLLAHRGKVQASTGPGLERERKSLPTLAATIGKATVLVPKDDADGRAFLELFIDRFGVSAKLAAFHWGHHDLNDKILASLSRTRLTPMDSADLAGMLNGESTPEQYLQFLLLAIQKREELGSINMVFSKLVVPTINADKIGPYAQDLDDALCQHAHEHNRTFRWAELLKSHRAGLTAFATLACESNRSRQAKGRELVELREEIGKKLTQEEFSSHWESMSADTIGAIGFYSLTYEGELEAPEPYPREGFDEVKPYKEGIVKALLEFKGQREKLESPTGLWMIGEYIRFASGKDAHAIDWVGRDTLMKSPKYRDRHMAMDLGL